MNIEPDGKHEIVANLRPRTPEDAARWLQITPGEAAQMQGMTPEQRRAWLKEKLPTKERLARHLTWIGLPNLAARARAGEFSDFDDASPHALPKNVLVQELELVRARFGKRQQAELIRGMIKLVIAGEYDDTKAESDAWAARQGGEVGEMLDKMSLREPRAEA